jgi:hypothetical protein
MANKLARNLLCAYPASAVSVGANSAQNLNSAFTFGTTGAYCGMQFTAPVGATYFDIWVYNNGAVTGSPTNIAAELRANDTTTATKPLAAGSVLGTPGSDTSFSGLASAQWVQLSRYTYTVVQNTCYFLYFINKTGTPASNYPSICYRGIMPANFMGLVSQSCRNVRGTDGFAGVPTAALGMPCFVLKFSDGSYFGNPYPESAAAYTNNTDWRGNRYTFDRDTLVSGVMALLGTVTNWNAGTWAVYQGATLKASGTISLAQQNTTTQLIIHFAPMIFYAGIAYDVIFQPASATTDNPAKSMGQGSIPADVTAAGFQGVSYVSGATPGSLSANSNQVFQSCVVIEDYPIIGIPRSAVVNR